MAALLQASGEPTAARELLEKARALAPEGALRPWIDAALRDPDAFTAITRGAWLLRNGGGRKARKLLGELVRTLRDPELRAGAERLLATPEPVKRAPTLFRINGCGVGLYGSRDRRADGSYIATWCLSLVFVPVLPLAAYRVLDRGGGSYFFVGKVRLGPIARAWQRLVALGLAGMIAWAGVGAYLRSPSRQLRVALGEARQVERSGDREAALARYGAVVDRGQRRAGGARGAPVRGDAGLGEVRSVGGAAGAGPRALGHAGRRW